MENYKNQYQTYITKRLLWVILILSFIIYYNDMKKGFIEGYHQAGALHYKIEKTGHQQKLSVSGLLNGYQLLELIY